MSKINHLPILLINTGGTISMSQSSKGLEPNLGLLRKQLQQMVYFKHQDVPDFQIVEFENLIDSANSSPEHWNKIANTIIDNYNQFCGFVVIHGTDTMAYTASALSFMLENLTKPVILTGSQVSLNEVHNDAHDNLIKSMLFANLEGLHEVCVYFNHKLMRGNRVTKTNAQSFDAYTSPNFPLLGEVSSTIRLYKNKFIPSPSQKISLQEIHPVEMSYFKIFPGFSIEGLKHILESPTQSIVLESYGTGNAPSNVHKFNEIIKAASARDIIILNITQCLTGCVKMEKYKTGNTLLNDGVISGHDMTPEAAIAKLYYLFSKYQNLQEIKIMLEKNLAGELTKC